MDAVYQAVKNFLGSFINLFVAIIELLTSLVNFAAFILGKLRPRISERYAPIRSRGFWKKGQDEERIQELRKELKDKISDKEKYDNAVVYLEGDGNGFYATVLAVLIFAMTAAILLCSRERLIFIIIAAALLCTAACIMIALHQKKMIDKRLARRILEEEFKDRIWEGGNDEKALPASQQLSENADNPY